MISMKNSNHMPISKFLCAIGACFIIREIRKSQTALNGDPTIISVLMGCYLIVLTSPLRQLFLFSNFKCSRISKWPKTCYGLKKSQLVRTSSKHSRSIFPCFISSKIARKRLDLLKKPRKSFKILI